MSIMKRLSTTIFSRVDESVRQLENHDAIITATLNETYRKIAQAKVRLNRVQVDGEKLRQRRSILGVSEKKWVHRACEQAESDENVALNCLHRRRECLQQIASLDKSILRHEKIENKLQGDLSELEQRLSKITQQRNFLRTRQSSAEVNRCLQEIEGLGCIDIDDMFERWEQRILEDEIKGSRDSCSDSLEKQFSDEELRKELQSELKVLRSQKEK